LFGIEIIRFAWGYNNLVKQSNDKSKTEAEILKLVEQLRTSAATFYKNYNRQVDEQLFETLMTTYTKSCETAMQAPVVKETISKYKGNVTEWSNQLFEKTIFADSVKLNELLGGFRRGEQKKIEKDPAYILAAGIYDYLQNTLAPSLIAFNNINDSLQRLYMAAQMEMQPDKRFYPDANSTLRVAYGNVKGYTPYDAVSYNWFTTLDGIMEKENPDIYDYVVEPKLKELYNKKDYGRYAENGKLYTCFLTDNDITGGNSGSPVLNGDGHLIGIAFDGNWEAMSGNILFEPELQRTIVVDIRYVLFVIDKYAGASNLMNELKVVQ